MFALNACQSCAFMAYLHGFCSCAERLPWLMVTVDCQSWLLVCVRMSEIVRMSVLVFLMLAACWFYFETMVETWLWKVLVQLNLHPLYVIILHVWNWHVLVFAVWRCKLIMAFFLAAMRYVFIGLHVIASLPPPPPASPAPLIPTHTQPL